MGLYTRPQSTPIRSKNPIKTDQKKIKFHLYTRARSTPIRSKPIKTDKKKSNFTCTLEHDQPPSDQNRSKPIKTDQKKIKFHLYTRARSTPIRSKNPIKKIKKNQILPVR